ncbi:MAG TPA: hypothetical protein VFL88_00345 [Gemmatimonadales bacterium]|nr:hypothetical protein [Gemmatimonadales bacterium]
MPPLSVLFIRTALLALVAGSLGGALMLSAKAGMPARIPSWIHGWHMELMLLGWFGNLTLGVAYWMFPKHATGRERGSPVPPSVAYALLNMGIVMSALGVMTGRLLELLAMVAFAINVVPRVKAFGVGRL